MRFTETDIPGMMVIEPELLGDERGFFARTWCVQEFADHGLKSDFVQSSISFNQRKGTLRGLHQQKQPMQEAKVIRCTRGAIFDVVVDLRIDSPAYLKHCSVTLTGDNRKMVYVPEDCAHGFQSLEDGSEVYYQMSQFHSPECFVGYRWNDPAFAIDWPLKVSVISERDDAYADYSTRMQS